MRVLGLAWQGTENWQCQAWHRRAPPRLIDLFYPPTGPGQESAHSPLCTDLPCARVTKGSILSPAGPAGVKLSASRAHTHAPSLLPHFFLSPSFSLIPNLVLILSGHRCLSFFSFYLSSIPFFSCHPSFPSCPGLLVFGLSYPCLSILALIYNLPSLLFTRTSSHPHPHAN